MERGFRICQRNRVAVFVTRSLKILVALILLSNCASSSNNLEFKIIEEAIPGVLLPDYPHLVTEVSCPEYVDGDLGTIFCTFTFIEIIRFKIRIFENAWNITRGTMLVYKHCSTRSMSKSSTRCILLKI